MAGAGGIAALASPQPSDGGGDGVQRPSAAFPGDKAEASHAAWPSGRQPRTLEHWPLDASGMPSACWKTTVLQDMHLGWPGKCHDLMRHEATNALECHESCTKDPACAVWQYNYMTQCWHGLGRTCGEVDFSGSDLLASGAQRLQHGDVDVLMDLQGWDIQGLHEIGDTTFGSWNHTLGVESCRAWCYSNLRCQYWLYSPGLCRAEDPSMTGTGVPYPLTLAEATRTSNDARNVIAGEFISHVCPVWVPPPPSLAAPSGTEGALMWGPVSLASDAVVGTLIVLAISTLWLRMRGYELALPAQRRRSGSTRCSSDAEDHDDGDATGAFGRTKTHERIESFIPAPVATFLAPTNLDPLLHGNFATAKERLSVFKALPDAPLPFANFLALRRSCAAALVLMAIVSYVLQVRVLSSTWRHHVLFAEVFRDERMQSYRQWVGSNPPNPSFVQYSKEKGLFFLAGILSEVLRGTCLVEAFACVTDIGPIVLLSLVVCRWTTFRDSRRNVMKAWIFFFMSAFVISVFPVHFMLSFEDTERSADQYVRELAVALNLDKAQEFLLGSCQQIESDEDLAGRMHAIGKTLKRTCSNLGMFPLQLAVPCIGRMAICRVDLRHALEGCREAVQQIEVGHLDKAVDIIRKECMQIRDSFTAPAMSASQEDGRSHAFEALVDMMRMPFHAIVPSVELVSITVSALHALVMVLPPVLGMAPGFMAAGFATKVLAPHSYFSGAIIIIVPIVLISVGWIATTMGFQYVRHSWSLVLLAFVVMYPLIFVWIAIKYRLPVPIDIMTLQKAARAAALSTLAVALFIAVLIPKICMDAGVSSESLANFIKLLEWCRVSWLRLGLACACRTLYSFALTFFAATDWMVGGVVVQQRYWRVWSQLGALGDGGGGCGVGLMGVSARSLAGSPMLKVSRAPTGMSKGAELLPPDLALMRLALLDEDHSEDVVDEVRDSDLADFLWHRLACRQAAEAMRELAASPVKLCGFAPLEPFGIQYPLPNSGSPLLGAAWPGLEAMALRRHIADGPQGGEEGHSTDSGSETSSLSA